MSTTWHDSRFGPGSYEHSAQEDRCVPRQRVNIPATLRISGGTSFHTVVHDLGAGGFAAFSAEPLPEGVACWLTLPGLDAVQAHVAWWREGRLGAAFSGLLDPAVIDEMLNSYSEARSPKAVR
ncbi:PilZ domain-containing protein [Novosphingobium sp. FKTRR1]|uniref:PilZ domain-containing protein n=1 Tax=Novosphingobium sp. FKTRR1 TaxID=2879118 RepID=UPI001CEFC6AC|nr:PilZ domain-containing protein [Novosphingobium sp. FKTRR1]